MTHRFKTTASAVALLLCATGAQAETLVLASTNAEPVPLNRFVERWAAGVNEAAQGAIEIDVRHGPTLANHLNSYDRVLDNVVDISMAVTVFNPGQFSNSLVMTMPLVMQSSEQGALAACRMYEAGAFGSDFDGLKVLYFYQFPQGSLHTTDTPITGLDSMAGLDVIATSPPAVEITRANGGNPISVPINEVYEALQRGNANAFINSFTTFPAFRLDELLKHHYIAPLGGALGVSFMSQERYEALGPEARAVIDANSTCEMSRQAGIFIDEWNNGALARVQQDPSHTVTAMTSEEVAALQARVLDDIKDSFSANLPGGSALVETLLAELEAARP